jgi:hypothetical protein
MTILGGRMKSESAKKKKEILKVRSKQLVENRLCTRCNPGDTKNKFMLNSGSVYFILQLNPSVPMRFHKVIAKSDD